MKTKQENMVEIIGFKPVIELDGRAVHPVVKVCDDEYVVTAIYGTNEDNLIEAVDELKDLIVEKYDDNENNNYGLSFYACGYDGKRQQAFQESCSERWEGVYVF